MNILLELHYLPCIQYISKFYGYEKIIIDDTELFEKQSYRNRCTIAGANGAIDLIVPVHDSRRRLPMKEIEIDNHTNWQHQHWQSIRSAYGKTAFFEHYGYKLEPFYSKQYHGLFDFNLDLLKIILKILKLEPERLKLLSEYPVFPSASLAEDSDGIVFPSESLAEDSDVLLSFKNKIHPKEKFKVVDTDFQPVRYHQAFGERHGFVPNLSVLDLIFNEGPETERILRESCI